MISNGAQSGISQGIDLASGEREHFSMEELAVDATFGGIGSALGDLVADPLESYAANWLRGFARGAGDSAKILVDTGFSWIGSLFSRSKD
jgi:hypothetical protein